MSGGQDLGTPPPAVRRSATLAYTAARLALFAAALGVLWLVRVRGPLLIVLALAISGLLSFVLLREQRVAMGGEIHRRIETIKARSAERTAREDAAVDAMFADESSAYHDEPDGNAGKASTAVNAGEASTAVNAGEASTAVNAGEASTERT